MHFEEGEQKMTSPKNFEDHHFNRIVNTIHPYSYPHQFSLHWHKYVEIAAYPDTGAVPGKPPVLRINQNTYELHPGDVLFIWPGELHETVSNEDNRIIGLQFNTSVFNDLPDFAPFLNLFRTFHHIRQVENPSLTQSMLVHIRHMLSVQERNEVFSGVEELICLYEMFMEFGTYIKETVLKDAARNSSVNNSTNDKINIACSYIIENCEQELTLESVADYIGFSSCYFSRIFKQATGYNFVEYLTLQRVKRAQILLSDSNLAITDISYQAGFKSISTFNRVFKQYRDCSPREYRKYYLT